MRTVAGIGALFFLTGAACLAMSVKTSYVPEVDYSAYRTYSWKPRVEVGPDHPLAEGGEVDRIVKQAADSILATQGFERTEVETPDLWINYAAFAVDKMDVEGIKREVSGRVSWIGDPTAHSTRSYREGTLVFEIFDAGSDELIWSGWASEVASSQEKLRKKAEKAARKILKLFPPR